MVGQVVLREYNQKPEWPHNIPMNDFLLELSIASESLFKEYD